MPHFENGVIPAEYSAYIGRKTVFLLGLTGLSALLLVAAVSLGAVRIPMADVLRTLLGQADNARMALIVWNIRLPQALAAILAGMGLSVAGAAMQSCLRNPLASPLTLGVSHAGAFGAAFSVMVLGSGLMQSANAGAVTILNPWLTTACAFAFCLLAALIILAVARLRGTTPEIMVLVGMVLNPLFLSGTMFLQYFADDVQLAAMVFWTFGDTARAGWREIAIMAGVVGLATAFFMANRWNYNAMDAGDETARSLGVRVESVRLAGMLVSCVLTAAVVSFLGVIGFVGLVCPHMVRRIIGDDHRFLLPASCLLGGALLLAADTVARLALAPHVLPVSVLTAFLGAPTFLYLLVRRRR